MQRLRCLLGLSSHTCANNVFLMQLAACMKGSLALTVGRSQPAQGACFYGNTLH